jgi:erythromycin esterase
MPDQNSISRRESLGLAIAAGAVVGGGAVFAPAQRVLAGGGGSGGGEGQTLAEWIDRRAVALTTLDPSASSRELRPLARILGDAQVVGLGESTHGTYEQFRLKHRVTRFLIEELGVRLLCWEESWGSGVAIDRYLARGEGDLDALLREGASVWRSQEMRELLRWVRGFNRGRRDKVRFVGTDLVRLHALLFEEIVAYTRDVAPDLLGALTARLDPLRLRGTPEQHIGWFFSVEDQQLYVEHARAVRRMLVELAPSPGDEAGRYALAHAAAIVGFYEYYAEGSLERRDRFMAETLIEWRDHLDCRALYWAANLHVAGVAQLQYSMPPYTPLTTGALAGGRLARRYGRGYAPLATVFHEGRVLTGWETGEASVFDVPPPGVGMVDHVLGGARYADYLLPLDTEAPRRVREALEGPATMRLIGSAYAAERDGDYAMTLPSFAGAFRAVLHVRSVTATRLLE